VGFFFPPVFSDFKSLSISLRGCAAFVFPRCSEKNECSALFTLVRISPSLRRTKRFPSYCIAVEGKLLLFFLTSTIASRDQGFLNPCFPPSIRKFYCAEHSEDHRRPTLFSLLIPLSALSRASTRVEAPARRPLSFPPRLQHSEWCFVRPLSRISILAEARCVFSSHSLSFICASWGSLWFHKRIFF